MTIRTVLQWSVAAFVVICGKGEAFSQSDFWQKINPPFGRTITSVAINAISTIIAGTDSGAFRSTDNGGTWTQSNSGLNPGVGYIVFSSGATIIAWGIGTANFPNWGDGYYRTSDNGSHWTQFIQAGGPVFRTAVAINDSGEIFGGWGNEGGGEVERSTDNGASWSPTGLWVNSYALAINASGTIFSGGWDSAGACVFRSTDNGSSWTNTGFFTTYYPVNVLAISPAGHVFAGTSTDGVFHSTDSGAHWIQSNSGMLSSFVTCLAINSSGHIFAGTFSEGVYRSTDDGANWTTVNSGLTNDSVSSIAINPSGTIFVGTKNGLFRSVQSTTAVRELSADGPISFSLDQNYPNPFNPSTTIRYELPRSSWVSLHVYSVLGQDVAALVNETRPAGVFTERFDAANLASGVYYYRLQAGDFVSTRKMVVLK